MNVLFLTLSEINDLEDRSIYTDLLFQFQTRGHDLTIITPKERRTHTKTNLQVKNKTKILQVKTLNIQKTNIIEKGLGSLSLEYIYLLAIRKFLSQQKFDLILYSTPPITFTNLIKKLKKRHKAKTYLLLKDIFPQNAVDLGFFSKSNLIYKYFKKKERQLYNISDYIGCMSPANEQYILKQNTYLPKEKVETCPNSIIPQNKFLSANEKKEIRAQYNIMENATTFIYGGNLGKPQGLDFLLDVVKSNQNNNQSFIFIVGSGTEYNKLNNWFLEYKPKNALLMKHLPKKEYDNLVMACDVGLIFLDNRFSIPNYPSRLLTYLDNKMPVLMAIDKNTDIGRIAEENNYGVWTENGDLNTFNKLFNQFCDGSYNLKEMGEAGNAFLKKEYTAEKSYQIIMKHFKDNV